MITFINQKQLNLTSKSSSTLSCTHSFMQKQPYLNNQSIGQKKILQSTFLQINSFSHSQRNLNISEEPSIIIFDNQYQMQCNSSKKSHSQRNKKLHKKSISLDTTQNETSSQTSENKDTNFSNQNILAVETQVIISQNQNVIQNLEQKTNQNNYYRIILPIQKSKDKILDTNAQIYIQRFLFFPRKFHMYINQQHKLSARMKLFHSNSLYYFFSNKQNLSTKGPYYVGYMKSNFQGTQYQVYSQNGINLGHFIYLVNEKSLQLKVILPNDINTNQTKQLNQKYKQKSKDIILLNNKKPTYNHNIKKYTLNMKGRAKCTSVKNFVAQYKNEYRLIFGKQKQKHYNLNFGQPFSELVAFALCIANYEEKVGFNLK